MDLIELFWTEQQKYARFLWEQLTHPGWGNYIYMLIVFSVFCFLIEWVRPWRATQPKFRRDFWLDAFYMFFNFFLFSLVIYHGASEVAVDAFNRFLSSVFGIKNLVAFEIATWPIWLHLLITFLVRDFVQFWIHRLLHRVSFLWEFHKVHHSVEQMGFAAHLRFHWMETLVYNSLQYIPLAMLGISLNDFFVVYALTTLVGHLNHSNIRFPLGPLKYVLNNPQMHIWHHVKDLPEGHEHGINFGLTLSIWDYLFGTACIPHDGRDIELGFDGMEEFPQTFFAQVTSGFRRPKK